jgi:hypothetical protein
MDLCGEVVVHKTYGTGRIVDFTNNYITVQFSENNVERIFVYPSAFGAFLEIDNETCQNQIQIDKDLVAQELSKNQRINEELMKLAIPVSPKKASAKSKKLAAKKSSY